MSQTHVRVYGLLFQIKRGWTKEKEEEKREVAWTSDKVQLNLAPSGVRLGPVQA